MKRSRSCGRRTPPIDAAGKAASRWRAVSSASSIGGSTAWEATDAPAPTATYRATVFSFRRRAWRHDSSSCNGGVRWNPAAQDPLFLPLDADDFRTNGALANDFSNLRENGLIRVTLPLPANVRLIDPATNAVSTETSVDVWRAVPSVFNVKLTGPDGAIPWPRGPNPTGGYQLDGRKATLQEQALGALEAHAQIANAPTQRLLDDLAAFQNVLFSSPRVRVLADAVRNGVSPLPDVDPPLNALEAQGKVVFTRACAQCHGGPGQSTIQAPLTARFHDIQVNCPRPVDTVVPARFTFVPCPPRLARNARTYEFTQPNGTVVRRTSSDPGSRSVDGFCRRPGRHR